MSISAENQLAGVVRLDAAFYERLFESAGLPIFVCELDGRILSTSTLGRKLLNAYGGPENLHGLLPDDAAGDYEESIEALRRTQDSLEFRARLVGRAEPEEFAVWLTPILDEAGNLQRMAVWFHDITARMQLRRAMRSRERLTALGTLSGSVAHHYNNLLCCIATSLEYAMNMNTMSAMRRTLRRTAEAAARATQLTQQLLAFAQADHRSMDMADLTEMVLYYVDEHEARLADAGIRLQLDWEQIPVLPLPREHLMIVLRNLIDNAAEAIPDGGDIRLALRRRDEHHVALCVVDSGAGIPADHLEHIFEPFFSTKGELARGATRREGMGLAVVHGLVNEMHGTVTAENEPGGGARFEIELPV